MLSSYGQVIAVWDHFPKQLPNARLEQRQLIVRMSNLEALVRKAVFVPVMLALVIAFAVTKYERSRSANELIPVMASLTLVYYYFVACAGVTLWTGFRVLYPMEGLGLILLALLMLTLFSCLGPDRGSRTSSFKIGSTT